MKVYNSQSIGKNTKKTQKKKWSFSYRNLKNYQYEEYIIDMLKKPTDKYKINQLNSIFNKNSKHDNLIKNNLNSKNRDKLILNTFSNKSNILIKDNSRNCDITEKNKKTFFTINNYKSIDEEKKKEDIFNERNLFKKKIYKINGKNTNLKESKGMSINSKTNPVEKMNSISNSNINNNSRSVKSLYLNKLYGINDEFYHTKRQVTNKNNEISLNDYQSDLLKFSSKILGKDHFTQLFINFQKIRDNTENTRPLPPINYPALVHHSFNQKKYQKKEMDEYEKELYLINKSLRQERQRKSKSYENSYRLYQILPPHIVDIMFRKKK